MNVLPLPLSFMTERFIQNEPFSLARYGDGEMLCIMKTKGHNCDGHEYFRDLGIALANSLIQPKDYLHCIAPKVMHRKNGLTEASVAWIKKNSPSLEWYDSETILNASLAGELNPFLMAICSRRVMLVGPKYLRALPIYQEFVEVPRINAWLHYDEIRHAILKNAYQVDVILFCAGMTSKVLIWTLYDGLGKNRYLLDIGSTFDCFVGVLSRSYARRLKPEEIGRLRALNFGVNEFEVST